MKCFKKIASFLVVLVAILVSAEAQNVASGNDAGATVITIPDLDPRIDISQNQIDNVLTAEENDAVLPSAYSVFGDHPSLPLDIIPGSIADTNVGLDDQAKDTRRKMFEDIAERVGIVLPANDNGVDVGSQALDINLTPPPLPNSAISDDLDSVRHILHKNITASRIPDLPHGIVDDNIQLGERLKAAQSASLKSIATRTGIERFNSDLIVGSGNSGQGASVALPTSVNQANLEHIDASNIGAGLNISRGNTVATIGSDIREDVSSSTTSTHNEANSEFETHESHDANESNNDDMYTYDGLGSDDGHTDTSAEVEDGFHLGPGNIDEASAVNANDDDDFGWAAGMDRPGRHLRHHRHHRHRDWPGRSGEHLRDDRVRGRDRDEIERYGGGIRQENWNRQWRTENVAQPLFAGVQGLGNNVRNRVQNMLTMMRGGGINANFENRAAFRPRPGLDFNTNFNMGNDNFGSNVGPQGFTSPRGFGIFGPPTRAEGFGNVRRSPLQFW